MRGSGFAGSGSLDLLFGSLSFGLAGLGLGLSDALVGLSLDLSGLLSLLLGLGLGLIDLSLGLLDLLLHLSLSGRCVFLLFGGLLLGLLNLLLLLDSLLITLLGLFFRLIGLLRDGLLGPLLVISSLETLLNLGRAVLNLLGSFSNDGGIGLGSSLNAEVSSSSRSGDLDTSVRNRALGGLGASSTSTSSRGILLLRGLGSGGSTLLSELVDVVEPGRI